MIQELLGGTVGGEERKNSINGGHLEGSSSLSTTSSDNNQNLRCPRCDSSNTKFCYYNNYNLTQPRHFCKTCRRYWTKGGALRNVPIGGGCRKNKSTSVSSSKTNVSKVKPALSEIGKSSYNNGFDQDLQSPNTITWVSGQNSHLLSSLLRTSHNPSPNQNSGIPRNECTMMGSYLSSESSLLAGSLNARNPDSLSQAHGGLYSCQRRYNQHNYPHYRHQQEQQSPQNTTFINELPNTDLQDLYQRIRSSVNYSDPSATLLNVGSTSSSILEPIPAIGGEPTFWNPVFSWPDLPATNGAFP